VTEVVTMVVTVVVEMAVVVIVALIMVVTIGLHLYFRAVGWVKERGLYPPFG
jgi:hypothetical protein